MGVSGWQKKGSDLLIPAKNSKTTQTKTIRGNNKGRTATKVAMEITY